MRTNIKVIALLVLAVAFTNQTRAQNKTHSSPPTDVATGFTYDFDKTRDLIIERVTDPKPSNLDVQVLLDQPDFPVPPKGKIIDAGYKDKLRNWMEKNPSLIINTLKNRKDIVTPF
jgi:hypothetical protein